MCNTFFDDVLYKSTDAARTWNPLNSPVLLSTALRPIRCAPAICTRKATGNSFRSRDAGATWETFDEHDERVFRLPIRTRT